MLRHASRTTLAVGVGTAIGVAAGFLIRSIEQLGWFLVEAPILGALIGGALAIGILFTKALGSDHKWKLFEVGLWGAFELVLFVALAFWTLAPETICIWDPLRDTKLSRPDIRERFKTIVPGMSTNDVVGVLGDPLNTAGHIWRYTSDGACIDCDKAWLMLAVRVDSGHVTEVIQQWEPD